MGSMGYGGYIKDYYTYGTTAATTTTTWTPPVVRFQDPTKKHVSNPDDPIEWLKGRVQEITELAA